MFFENVLKKLAEARGDTNNVSQLGWIAIVAIILVALIVIVNRVFPQIANGVFAQVATALGITIT